MSVPGQSLAAVQQRPNIATASDMREHVNRIQQVMEAVMKDGTHFGKIPGTDKPTLLKPGAEVLCATFHIAPSFRVDDLSTEDAIRYRVVCVGVHQGSGVVLGEGLGECSSNEEKYKWRKASDKEWAAAPDNRRRIKYGFNRAERREYEIKQVRAEVADVANTILKMAAKRAQVAMTLNVTAASDIFAQDIEDLPEHLRNDDDAPVVEKKVDTKPAYAAEAFAKNLPAWSALVAAGTSTPQQILAKLESKATLTDEQRKQINAMKKTEATEAAS